MEILTYYTTGDNGYYEEQAAGWWNCALDVGYLPRAIELPSGGDWLENTRRKALVIAAAYTGRPLLWLDVDDRLAGRVELPSGVDVAGIPSGLHGRALAAPLLYFAGTDGARELIREWVRVAIRMGEDRSDEWALNVAIKKTQATVGFLDPQVRKAGTSTRRGRFWASSDKSRYGAPVD